MGKRFRITHPRRLTETEKHFYSVVESMTEREFVEALNLLPGDRLEITGVHNYNAENSFLPSGKVMADTAIETASPFPIVVTELLPF